MSDKQYQSIIDRIGNQPTKMDLFLIIFVYDLMKHIWSQIT